MADNKQMADNELAQLPRTDGRRSRGPRTREMRAPMTDDPAPDWNRLDWYRERIADHERELEDLDEEYHRRRAEIEHALTHLREKVAREYPNG
jgi:hypothetical protein